MRILYVYDTPVPDTGADTEQVINNLAALSRRGLQVELLVPGPASGPADGGTVLGWYETRGTIALHRLRSIGGRLRLVEKWAHALRAVRHPAATAADLLYTRNLPAAALLLLAGRHVVYEHFRPWGDQVPALRPFLRWIFRHRGLVGAILHSEFARGSYLRLGAAPERLLVAHNGWDPARMEPRLTREEARRRLGLAPDRFTVVYSGRMNARKGLDILLEAARQAPEMVFVLIGSEGEGPVEAEARGLANVRVVPWLRFSALAPWLYAGDAVIIPPSLAPLQRHGNTVLPLKLFLYLAAGRVLVAPEAPDTAELLSHDRNAVLVPPGNVTATITALRSLAADPARVQRLGAAALETARGLTWDARADRILRFLEQRRREMGLEPASKGALP